MRHASRNDCTLPFIELSKTEFKALVPDSWEVKVYPSTPTCLIIHVPKDEGGGSLTINPRRRWWAPGMFSTPLMGGSHGTWFGVDLFGGEDGTRYKGRGWRQRMVEDINLALAQLREEERERQGIPDAP